MKKIRIILCQLPLGEMVSRKDFQEIQDYRPDFVCFPEYFFVNRRIGNHGQTPHNFKRQMSLIELLSKKLDTTVIGGTMPEVFQNNMYNTSFVFDNGRYLGYYRKINLFFAEVGKITPGTDYKVFQSRGVCFGILICADVFFEESFLTMKRMGAQIVFIPTFSPRKIETIEEKYRRDQDIFVKGAHISDCVLAKVCGVPSAYKDFIQARSLITDAKGIIYRVPPEAEERSLIIKQEITIRH